MNVLAIVSGFFYLWMAALCIRNILVFRWRTFFLRRRDPKPFLYKRLPGYFNMLFNPWHWTRWSQEAWIEYASHATEESQLAD
jgi:hypothetical protein